MSGYRCRRCEATFSEPGEHRWRERVEYWGCVTMETFSEPCCPECGYEDFDECELQDDERERV